MAISPDEIAQHLAAVDAAPDTAAQGAAFETLVGYLFGSIPGCLAEANVVSPFATEQIDFAVSNQRLPHGLHNYPPTFLIECKDWSKAVGSLNVGYFLNIMASRAIEVGVFVAANGLSGGPGDMKHSHALGMGALARGMKLVVLTRTDIESIVDETQFVGLLVSRLLRAWTGTGIGID